MAKKKGGIISRLLIGSEKSEGYARASLPSNRWELFWDIFKSRFWKLVLLNLLILLFFIPVIALFVLRWIATINLGQAYPFAQAFGVGYQAPYTLAGLNESIVLNVNMLFYALLPVAALIASVGIAGGAFVIRNMVWSEGVFVANDFWQGVKENYKKIVIISVLFTLVFYVTEISISLANLNIARGMGVKWLFVLTKVFSYVILIWYAFMTLHMITMTVTYDLKMKHLIKNSFLFTLGLLPQNVFFAFLGTIPFLVVLLGGTIGAVGFPLVILFGLSVFLLVWTNFCQWAYDEFINDKIKGAKKNRGMYERINEKKSKTLSQYKGQVDYFEKSKLASSPIKPITDEELKIEELPQAFNRNDILKLEESKQKLKEDNDKYVEEHKNDEKYKFEESAEEKERRERIEKAKKELEKREK